MTTLKLALSALALSSSALAANLPSISIKGSKFFFENGTQFFIKGVGYQQDSAASGSSTSSNYTDPLADAARCKKDVPIMSALGINTIRTYAINPKSDHTTCMQLLNDAGIYVISDLSEPTLSINRNDPLWNNDLYDRYKAVVDSLANYTNVIGFFAGNEVSNQANNTGASAYVKAAVRDTKLYIKNKNYRSMGVGYAANDDEAIRDELSAYFNCGDSASAIDFFGYNIYSWCGTSTFQESGYNRFIEAFQNYSVPVFFAEYGCNTQGGAEGRKWDETTALYTKNMSDVVNGGIVYQYFEEENDYGLVKVSGDDTKTMTNYKALQTKLRAAEPTGVSESSYTSTNSAQSCPTIGSSWEANSNLPPTPNESACSCMVKAASCVVKSSTSTSDYSDLFDYICGKDSSLCAGVNGNATTGVYGAFSMCSDSEKLAYVLNAYYVKQSKASTACDFSGKAQTQTADTSGGNCTEIALSNSNTNNSGSSNSSSSKNDSSAANGVFSPDTLVFVAALFGGAMLLL